MEKMNWENLRIKYIEYGIPLFLLGIIIYALSLILGYVLDSLYIETYFVGYITFFGLCMMGIFSFSFLFIGGGK